MFAVLLALSASTVVQSGIAARGPTPLNRRAEDPLETYPAYDDTLLAPPPLPDPMPALDFVLAVASSGQDVPGLAASRAINGSFWGFSIELSIVDQVLGKDTSSIPTPFLNLMSNIVERAGSVNIRCGGEAQETADMVTGTGATFDTTFSPVVIYTEEWLSVLNSISTSVPGVGWYLGIPFDQTDPYQLEIAEYAEKYLGENLLGLQAANEPDSYVENGLRTEPYTPSDYFEEFTNLVEQINANEDLTAKDNLIGPSVSGRWSPEEVFATGYLDAFKDVLSTISVQNYTNDNCGARYNNDYSKNPQEIFPSYLTHRSSQKIVSSFTNASQTALASGKEMVMFETNTADCGGFPGISNSFGATLWALDYGMQMAYHNFSHALLSVGGQDEYYNPFTAPPANTSDSNQWTIGAVYYSVLAMSEAVGNSGTARFLSLGGNEFTPQYAIYESDDSGELALSKLALFNYMTNPDGAADLNVTVRLVGSLPSQINVKYLRSSSVSTKDDITWGGQTFGTKFNVDGRLQGKLLIDTIACEDNKCKIPVPAPGFALVFFDEMDTIDVQTFSSTGATASPTGQAGNAGGATGDNEDSAQGKASNMLLGVSVLIGMMMIFCQ